MTKNFIASAIKRPGALTAKAKTAGKSVAALTTQVTKPGAKATTLTKKQANFAKVLNQVRPKK